MSTIEGLFPTVAQLRSGVTLCTIAHAIWTIPNAAPAYEQSWDGLNYSFNDGQGNQGTITFDGDRVVGVLFDHDSTRSPLRDELSYDIDPYFLNIPEHLWHVAETETLQYQLFDLNGMTIPIDCSILE